MRKSLPPPDKKRLDALLKRTKDEATHMLGYPSTHLLDFSPLLPFMDTSFNNIGDPFAPSSYRINTHDLEREVIAWFKTILHAPEDGVWGYVTSGGTEGNMYGMYLAREFLPGGIVYYSEDTHYSIAKILRLVGARSIMIKSQPNGEMDYDDLAATLSIHRDSPPIIFANIGTTMRGAIDNLESIKTILKERAIHRYYIHADAALSGMILPFTDNPQPFDFDAGIDSIAISGHKMPGSPMPCGVVLARRSHTERIARAIEYIGTNDMTIAGSRSGIAPLYLWYVIQTLGIEGFHDIIAQCQEIAAYTITAFARYGIKAWRHDNSLTIVFPRRNEDVLKKWQIATQGKDAHLICMPHVTKLHIDNFLQEWTAAFRNAEQRTVKQAHSE
ncbi:MAG: histidine decarboxylase [Pseudomonadota bacterium]|nr:histidine decarboxylase [Pseudomonadota bacterium]QKK06210.1 MAG: histidine decarboxylase [Pseudomonadota bacterium]